jgi:hypothetical protein
MTKYIDKNKIKEAIEKRFDEYSSSILKHYDACTEARASELGKILTILDTLEVKEEILDKEGKTNLMQKCVHEAYKRGYGMGAFQTTNKMNHNTKEVDLEKEIEKEIETRWYGEYLFTEKFKESAKHFYELGLRTKGD